MICSQWRRYVGILPVTRHPSAQGAPGAALFPEKWLKVFHRSGKKVPSLETAGKSFLTGLVKVGKESVNKYTIISMYGLSEPRP
jgi:hypothetical protein